MERRRFLAALAVTSLAGCQRSRGDGEPSVGTAGVARTGTGRRADPRDGTGGSTTSTVGLARHGYPSGVCDEEPMDDPGIYAVTDPATAADWRGHEIPDRYRGATAGSGGDGGAAGLAADRTVVGLGEGEHARAYPLDVLWVHEIVNDSLAVDAVAGADGGDGEQRSDGEGGSDEVPVLVSFCPLCNSGLVARRVVDGAPTAFLVTGLLWQAPRLQSAAAERAGDVFGAAREDGGTPEVRNSGNLVMVDRATGSYWSQILAQAICGPERGTHLEIVPSTVTTWGAWRRDNPKTDVLLPPPHSGTAAPGD